MSSYDDSPLADAGHAPEAGSPARVGTVVWGLSLIHI